MTDNMILKDKINGYHYTNASKSDKTVLLAFQLTETEAYYFNITFPKCRITYVFLFYDQTNGNKLSISGKSATNLVDAMDQPNFASRIPMKIITILDPTRQTINFGTLDDEDKLFTSELFDSNSKLTQAGKGYQQTVRQAVIAGRASTTMDMFSVDGLQYKGSDVTSIVENESGSFTVTLAGGAKVTLWNVTVVSPRDVYSHRLLPGVAEAHLYSSDTWKILGDLDGAPSPSI